MKFGVLRDDVEGNYDAEGYPNYEEFVYADTLDLTMYYDVSTMAYVTEYYEEANLDEDTMKTAVQGLVTDYATDDDWTYDGMRDWEKEYLMEEEWFNVWEYDATEFGDIAFHEDQEYIIYQEGEVSFDFKEWDFGTPGTTITVRLYCNGANVKIDGRAIEDINKEYIQGNTKFVVLRNKGIFQAGFINFLTFRYSIVEDNLDESTMKTAVQNLVTDYATDDSWTYDGMRDWEKEYLMGEDWFNVWEYDDTEFGDIAFHEDQEYIIYQEGEVSFDFKEWDFGTPGTTITVRLYCNGANVKIDGRAIEDINKEYIQGNTKFVVLRNKGIFQAGFINFLTFRYSIVEDNFGVAKDEIRVTVDVVEEHAFGSDRGVTDWRAGTYYRVGDDILYNLQMYNCIEAHTSSLQLEG